MTVATIYRIFIIMNRPKISSSSERETINRLIAEFDIPADKPPRYSLCVPPSYDSVVNI